jgi:hypothetical protein
MDRLFCNAGGTCTSALESAGRSGVSGNGTMVNLNDLVCENGRNGGRDESGYGTGTESDGVEAAAGDERRRRDSVGVRKDRCHGYGCVFAVDGAGGGHVGLERCGNGCWLVGEGLLRKRLLVMVYEHRLDRRLLQQRGLEEDRGQDRIFDLLDEFE